MAMNPMQRRARNSFLIGFVIALLIGALAVGALLMKIKEANAQVEALQALQTHAYVAAKDIKSGEEIEFTDLDYSEVQTTVDSSKMIADTDFQEAISDTEVKDITLIAKTDIPAGEIITKSMLTTAEDETTDTDRTVEYNMVELPSHLENGDYIDIRFSLPSGQDFIVLSKKKVIGCTATGIWLKLNELEIELMNNAIVESYIIEGAKLYALEYSEAGLQKASAVTYVASQDVVSIMNSNPNILDDIFNQYQQEVYDLAGFRTNAISTELDKYSDNKGSAVADGNEDEKQVVSTSRSEYVSELEGTDSVGYNEQ